MGPFPQRLAPALSDKMMAAYRLGYCEGQESTFACEYPIFANWREDIYAEPIPLSRPSACPSACDPCRMPSALAHSDVCTDVWITEERRHGEIFLDLRITRVRGRQSGIEIQQ